MVVSMQHSTPGQRPPRSTTTNTYKYPRCNTSNVEEGGGGPGSQTRCSRHSTLTHNKKKKMTPTTGKVATVCSIRPRGKAHLTPSRQIHRNTHDAEKAMWRRAGAGLGHRHDATGIPPSDTINTIRHPPLAPMPACNIRPLGNFHLAPPQQIHINTQDAAHQMWRREGAGVGHGLNPTSTSVAQRKEERRGGGGGAGPNC